MFVEHQMNFHVCNKKEDKISKPVGTSWEEAVAQVSL